jgi:uncharacterized protein
MYFAKAGLENTAKTLEIACTYAKNNKIRDIIIASTTGYTARTFVNDFPYGDFRTTVVTHNVGFKDPGDVEFPRELREDLSRRGIKVLTGTLVLRGLGTAIREKLGYSEQDLIAHTLRMFSQGVKVCVEISAMAVDAGLVPPTDVIAIAGTGRGADTACLIGAQSSNKFFDIRVREILAKPKEF